MTITVLGISGSPRRHGNTETLLDSFLDGAKSAGDFGGKSGDQGYQLLTLPGVQRLPQNR